MTGKQKTHLLAACLAFFKLGLHLATNTNYEMHRDGMFYYALGRHPAWGYVSVPPLAGLLARFSTSLMGNTAFAMRLLPAVIGSLSVLVIAKIIEELEGGRTAVIIGSLAFIFSPAFLRSNTLFQPVSFGQFFWLLSAYIIIKLLKTQHTRLWVPLFIVWGAGFNNKYSIAFLIAAFFSGLVLTRSRRLVWSRWFIIGSAAGLLIILPNLIWQYTHNWPVVLHMAELQKHQLSHVTVTGFLADQLVMNIDGLFVWVAGLAAVLFSDRFRTYRTVGFMYLFTLGMLLAMRGKSYYTLGLYPALFAFGGAALDIYVRNWVKYTVVLSGTAVSVVMVPISLPVCTHARMAEFTKPAAGFVNRWEDGRIHTVPQDFADMTGWKELVRTVSETYRSVDDAEQARCRIYTENYGQASAVMFYGRARGLPEPVCFNDNFLLWAPDTIGSGPMIYVGHDTGHIERLFGSCIETGQVRDPYFRENGLRVFLCTEPEDSLSTVYVEKVSRLKQKYRK